MIGNEVVHSMLTFVTIPCLSVRKRCFMRTRFILGGLVALGLTAAVPSVSQAAPAPEKRHETRHEEGFRHEEHRDIRRDRVVVEHRDFDRHDFRFERDRFIPGPIVVDAPVVVDPGYSNFAVSIGQVPPVVLDAANRLSGGAPITGVDFIHVPGATFYDVHVAQPSGYQTLRFGINGGFFGYR
jgi:hypothetical protein